MTTEKANTPRKPRLTLTTFADMAADPPELDWLVDGVMVAGQPMVIGGPAKCLKTSVALDLAVSLATGTPFLGTFAVSRRQTVAVFSGESGHAVVYDTMQRILKARGTKPASCNVHLGFRLPRLGVPADRKELRGLLRTEGVGVVVIDPLYLCLAGNRSVNASNLYEVGAVLAAAADSCRRAGATLVLVHHAKKASTKDGRISLQDLSQAGIGEFARQWLLLGRQQEYEAGTGVHELTLAVGGSAGHSSRWHLTVDEGTAGSGKRGWRVEVSAGGGRRNKKPPSRGPSPLGLW
jgi:RecA-family ATPase